MKTLLEYLNNSIIIEADEDSKDDEKQTLERGEIKFTIWESPDKRVDWITSNDAYQKIEYKYEDKDNDIFIDFLLGFKDNSWQLWIGRIGSCSYDDDPYKNFNTDNFAEGIVSCLDYVEEFVQNVKDDPTEYIQFYKEI